MASYSHTDLETKWQKFWQEHQTFATPQTIDLSKPKQYILDMFPYPSGAGLHVGHPKGYTATDVLARYSKAKGYNVLHTMGWDAFGLPAENYAIKTGTHPKITTEANINTFRTQLQSIGFSYDWAREVDTTDPNYYQWTQWIFLKLWERGLAYEAEMPVWWCPNLKAVLANEEVVNGKSEVGGHPVERRNIRQWVLRITEYADRLLEDLNDLDWPDGIKEMQRNWIGRSEGIEIEYPVENSQEVVKVYTKYPETNFGATFVVIAPEHPILDSITTQENKEAIAKYRLSAARKSELERTELAKEKTGAFTGAYAINRLTGKKLPIYAADFVLANYGTGMVVGVPGHDVRDFEFAKKFNLPIVRVLRGADGEMGEITNVEKVFEEGTIVNSDFLDGLSAESARERIKDFLVEKAWGERTVNYKLRDWIFSRQRYWGEPIPIIHLDTAAVDSLLHIQNLNEALKDNTACVLTSGEFAKLVIGGKIISDIRKSIDTYVIADYDLPLKLPETPNYEPSDDGASPLARLPDFVHIKLADNLIGKRETNTMPQWGGSCWYYLRFMDPKNPNAIASREALEYWGSVDHYVGGAEHAVLHLLYARFWHKVLFDCGVVPTIEPFQKLRNVGLILGEDGEKMSKSRGNVINPNAIVEEFGADTLRLYEMYMADFKDAAPWNPQAIIGMRRFLDRTYTLFAENITKGEDDIKVMKRLHKSIKKVGEDIESYKFNTAIAELITLVNGGLPQDEDMQKEWKEAFVVLLHPFAPHMAEELFAIMGNHESIYGKPWPTYDAFMLTEDEVTIAIQVDGKLRGTLTFLAGVAKEEVIAMAEETPEIARFLSGRVVEREIFIPGKLLNLVTREA